MSCESTDVLDYIRRYDKLDGKGPRCIAPEGARRMGKKHFSEMCNILGITMIEHRDTVDTMKAKLRITAGVAYPDDVAFLVGKGLQPPESSSSDPEISPHNTAAHLGRSSNAHLQSAEIIQQPRRRQNRTNILPPRRAAHSELAATAVNSSSLISIELAVQAKLRRAVELKQRAAELEERARQLMQEANDAKSEANALEDQAANDNLAILNRVVWSRSPNLQPRTPSPRIRVRIRDRNGGGR